MADIKVRKAKITDLIPDDRNLNKGTERGKQLIAKSLNKFGAVRGIAVDKDNRIIASNKTVENAIEQGIEDVIIVETTGKELARDIVTMLSEALNDEVEGMAIVMRGTHLCKTMRGVKSNGQMSVAHLSGVFQENSDARREFYRLIELNK